VNVELEVSVKLKVNEEPLDPKIDARQPLAGLVIALGKLASHPCVPTILREYLRNS